MSDPSHVVMPTRPPIRPEVAVAAATLRIDAHAAEVVGALRAAGVGAILLKGPSVVRALYADGGARRYVDVDLLIEPARFARAAQILAEIGFEPVTAPVIDARVERHADPWRRARDGALVDVHWTLPWVHVPREKAWAVLAAETESIEVGGDTLAVLAAPALALHLALHAVYHGRADQVPLRDLELAIDRWNSEVWAGARRIAAELDALAALRAGLMMVPGGTPVADELELPEDFSAEVRLAAFGPPGATELERLLAHASWRERIQIVARQLVPPRAFMYQWSPRARNGFGWLLLAYTGRLWMIARRIGPALGAFRDARRARGR